MPSRKFFSDDVYCDRCGEYLPEGSLRYTVHIQVLSDFDGMVVVEKDCAGETRVSDGEAGRRVVDEALCQEYVYVLCADCREIFVADPFNRGPRRTSFFRSGKPMYH